MHPPTIVCAVDYSDCSRRALRSAGALTAHFGARLFVLHVADALRLGAVGLEQIMGDKGRDELQPFVAANLHPAPWRGHEPELVVVLGSPAHEIARFADKCRADLIVIGSHGYTGARKAFFGSTAQEVLRLAQVPVLALPLGGGAAVSSPLIASGPVVAPVDFSAESCAAAHVAARLARWICRSCSCTWRTMRRAGGGQRRPCSTSPQRSTLTCQSTSACGREIRATRSRGLRATSRPAWS